MNTATKKKDLTAGLDEIMNAPAAQVSAPAAPSMAGLSVANTLQVRQLLKQIEQLEAAAKEGGQTLVLDPRQVKPHPLANRHEDEFLTQEYLELKRDIGLARGNRVPGLVMRGADGGWLLIFGGRRRRGCQDTGNLFKALELTGEISDQLIAQLIQAENENHKKPSIYEQGVWYQRMLDRETFNSERALAEGLGVSHTWVGLALDAARLPSEVVRCFGNVTLLSSKAVAPLTAALQQDRDSVMTRAMVLADEDKQRKPAEVLLHLLHDNGVTRSERPRPMRLHEKAKPFATVRRDAKGAVQLKLDPAFTRADVLTIQKHIEELAKANKALQAAAAAKAGKKGKQAGA